MAGLVVKAIEVNLAGSAGHYLSSLLRAKVYDKKQQRSRTKSETRATDVQRER